MATEDNDPTTEEILTALRTIGIAGGELSAPRGRKDAEETARAAVISPIGGTTMAWTFWIKNKYVYRDDAPKIATTQSV